MSLGEGFGVRFKWVPGGGFPVENEGKREWARDGGGCTSMLLDRVPLHIHGLLCDHNLFGRNSTQIHCALA